MGWEPESCEPSHQGLAEPLPGESHWFIDHVIESFYSLRKQLLNTPSWVSTRKDWERLSGAFTWNPGRSPPPLDSGRLPQRGPRCLGLCLRSNDQERRKQLSLELTIFHLFSELHVYQRKLRLRGLAQDDTNDHQPGRHRSHVLPHAPSTCSAHRLTFKPTISAL